MPVRTLNPLRIDPTRTITLRRKFAAQVRKRFAKLRYEVYRLVAVEDAFGLKVREPLVIANKFCPTGEGGGVDPTCGKESGGVLDKLKALGGHLQHYEHIAAAFVKDKVATAVQALPEPYRTATIHSWTACMAVKQVAFAAWTANQALAEKVSQERGATPEEARRLRGVLSSLDLAAFKPLAIATAPLGGVVAAATWVVPPATGAYLAYSTAASVVGGDPLMVLRAAHKLVKESLHGAGVKIGEIGSFAVNSGDQPRDELGRFAAAESGSGSGVIKDKHGKEWRVEHTARKNAQGEKKHVYEIQVPDKPSGVTAGGAETGWNKNRIMSVGVHGEYQRRGLASALYDHIEKHIGKVEENWATTPDGEAFWKARKGKVTANSDRDSINLVADALQQHGYSDWYIAVLSAAIDELKDVREAIALANRLTAPIANASFFSECERDDKGRCVSKKVKIELNEGGRPKKVSELLPGMTHEAIAAVAGAMEGATVKITPGRNNVVVEVDHPDYYCTRTVGKEYIVNDELVVHKTGGGLGTHILTQQVEAAVSHGYTRIETTAARHETMNGYYTWPRLGYDGDDGGGGRVSDHMKTSEGRAWWKEHGETFHGTFDLTEGSQSRKVLNAYNEAKRTGAGRATANSIGRGRGDPRRDLGRPVGNAFDESKHPRDASGHFAETSSLINGALKGAPEDVKIKDLRDDKARVEPSLTSGGLNDCFNNAAKEYNAQKAAGNDPKYVVGIVYGVKPGKKHPEEHSSAGFQHAWIEVNGKIVEPTKGMTPYKKVMYDGKLSGGKELNPYLHLNTNRVVGNARFSFHSDPEKVKAFQKWLKQQVTDKITSATEEELWRKYAEAGYKKGQGRAFDDVRKPYAAGYAKDQSTKDFYRGTKEEFLRSSFGSPVAVDKVKLLAGRSFDDLENVTADMSTRMSRTLTDGLVRGDSPRDVARELAEDVDLSEERALTIARTEIIRAHAEGQLDAMENLGVEEVGASIEFSTTGDSKVCDKCAHLEGVVLTIDEARGIIPAHPNCRCSWIPAGVGEDDEGQKDSKREIDRSFKNADIDKTVDRVRPESVVGNALAEFSHWLVENADQPRDDKGRWASSGRVIKVDPGDLVHTELGPSDEREEEAVNGFGTSERLNHARAAHPVGKAYPPLVVVEQEGGDHHILDGHHRAIVAEERGHKLPAIVLKDHEHLKLQAMGYSDTEISYAALRAAGSHEQLPYLRQKLGDRTAQRGEEAAKHLEGNNG